jgi:hypothetical protein
LESFIKGGGNPNLQKGRNSGSKQRYSRFRAGPNCSGMV